MTQFNFKEQLEVGQQGEADFLKHYHSPLSIHPDRDGDFITEEGLKLELKTDTYRMHKTDNFFIERYSVLQGEKPGSLWQALEHGCTLFCYYFTKDNTYFEIADIPRAIQLVEQYLSEKKPGAVYIKNRGYVTVGYKVPRSILLEVTKVFTHEADS